MSFGLIVTVVAYTLFVKSTSFESLLNWAQINKLIFLASLIFVKALGIVWPPIPGGVLTLGSIPILGWQLAYFSDFLGSMIGSTVAYYLGRKYGIPFLKKILSDEILEKVEKIKMKSNKEFEAIFFLRAFGGTVVEIIVYAAGLLKVNFVNFLSASVLSHLIFGIPGFYLTSNVISGENYVITLVSLGALAFVFSKFKGRYFE